MVMTATRANRRHPPSWDARRGDISEPSASTHSPVRATEEPHDEEEARDTQKRARNDGALAYRRHGRRALRAVSAYLRPADRRRHTP